MRAAIGLRLLLALTLMGWGWVLFLINVMSQFRYLCILPLFIFPLYSQASAPTYVWIKIDGDSTPNWPSAAEACVGIYGPGTILAFQVGCYHHSSQIWLGNVTKIAICSEGTFDPNTNQCVGPPPDCSTEPDIYSAQECTYNESLKLFICPDTVNSNQCSYVSSPNGQSNCDISTSICVGRYSPTGNPSTPNAPECTDSTCAPLPSDPGQAPENCVANGDSTYCFEDQESGCGTFNGQEGCFEQESGCGTFNGTWGCYSTDKDQRNCGYANGQQVCFDPKNPTQQISDTSPDHPKNGGNADGNENNDPTAPGSSTGSAQGSDQGATNESIDELGEKLGPKIDKTNSLLDGITNKLSELTEGLLGEEYDGSGDGDLANSESVGAGAGSEFAEGITLESETIIAMRDAEAESTLDEIPNLVSGQAGFFDPDGPNAEALDFLNGILPTHSSCVDYPIDFELGQYSSTLVLPVCELTRIKPLLEWVIWLLTAIGLWKILYSGLRLEDSKASKGGF